MVKTSEILLELPKRTAVLVEERDAARIKVRGLFWLTLATVVLGLVVVLASLWKTFVTPSVRAPSASATVATPPAATSATCTPVPTASDAPADVRAAAPPIDAASSIDEEVELELELELELEPEPEVVAVPSTPPGFPSLDQFP